MFLFRLCCELVVAEVSRLWKSCLGRSSTPVGVLLVLDVSGEWWNVWCLFTFQGFALRESEVPLLSRPVLHCVQCSCIRVAQVTSLFAVDGLSRLLLRPVSSSCHPCPPDAHATQTGIDCPRDRLGEISISHGSGADAGWYSMNHERDSGAGGSG